MAFVHDLASPRSPSGLFTQMRGLMKSKDESIPPESQYRMTFPFTDISLGEQEITTRNFECALFFRELSKQPCAYMDDLLNIFSMLQTMFGCRNEELYFVDCMSSSGSAAFLALSSRFGKVLGIELSSQSRLEALDILDIIKDYFPENCDKCELRFIQGSFQDYLPLEANVVFLDCSLLIANGGLLDEGVIMGCLLEMSRKLASSTYVIIVTIYLLLDQATLAHLGHNNHLKCIYHRQKKNAQDFHIWVLQTMRR